MELMTVGVEFPFNIKGLAGHPISVIYKKYSLNVA